MNKICSSFILVLSLTGCAGPNPNPGERTTNAAVSESKWDRKIERAEEFLAAEKWSRARSVAFDVGLDIVNDSLPADSIHPLVAKVAFIQAVAYAEENDELRAKWFWQMARIFDSETITPELLTPYPNASFLANVHPRQPQDAKELATIVAGNENAPQLLNGKGPEYSTKSLRAGHSAAINVEVLLSPDGTPSDPMLLNGQETATFSYPILAVLVDWRWAPILVDGDPGIYRYQVTVRLQP